MKLKIFRAQYPVTLEGEDGAQPQSFMVGARVGKGIVTDIEATTIGILILRKGDPETLAVEDILITGPGHGITLERRRAEPAQLKGAR